MARYDEFGNPIISSSAPQAHQVFGYNTQTLTGNQGIQLGSPHLKFLFYVRFVRGDFQGDSRWARGLTLAVRTVDRPTESIETKELNQYNKKRLITTGVKYGPVNMSFYDTSDGAAQSMWSEYSNWYIGDMRQNRAGWNYDVTMPQFSNNGGGFGYQPRPGNDPTNNSSQNFFTVIEIFQLFGGKYIRTDLINPKITTWQPDDLDVTNMGDPATIRCTVDYEATYKSNNGIPVPLTSDLAALFNYPIFDGSSEESIDPFGVVPGEGFGYGPYQPGMAPGNRLPSTEETIFGTRLSNQSSIGSNIFNRSNGGGSLSNFGGFDFGSGIIGGATKILSNSQVQNSILGGVYSAALSGTTRGLPGSIAGAILGPQIGAAVSGVGRTGNVANDLAGAVLGSQRGLTGAISGQLFDVATGATGVKSNGSTNKNATSTIASMLVGAALTQNNSPTNNINRNNSGITLNSNGYGLMNNNRPQTSQIGNRLGQNITWDNGFNDNPR
jgi:hypothetical protein